MEDIKKINDDIKATEDALEGNKATFKAELDSANQQIELLKKENADLSAAIKKYQELNQSLFLRVAAPMQEQQQVEKPKDPDLVSALEKIRIHNEGVIAGYGNNNEQGTVSPS